MLQLPLGTVQAVGGLSPLYPALLHLCPAAQGSNSAQDPRALSYTPSQKEEEACEKGENTGVDRSMRPVITARCLLQPRHASSLASSDRWMDEEGAACCAGSILGRKMIKPWRLPQHGEPAEYFAM